MDALQNAIMGYCWATNIFCLALIAGTRLMMNQKWVWAGVGCILLFVAIMNALLLGATDLSPTNTGASLFGLVVLGSLGARFVGNWLTDGAA